MGERPSETIIYNSGHRFLSFIDPPSQEEIYNCPEFFACSTDEVKAHAGTPEFLKRLIDSYPWADRPNVLQIRPQDFRNGKPELLGDHWHVDVNVRLKDGKVREAKDIDDWRLLVCSWGNIVETEFIKTPLHLPNVCETGNHPQFFAHVNTLPFQIEACLPNQLAEYTSRDIHRMGSKIRPGRFRLMIVAFESSTVTGDGWVLPSIREKENGNTGPAFKDYIL